MKLMEFVISFVTLSYVYDQVRVVVETQTGTSVTKARELALEEADLDKCRILIVELAYIVQE